MNEDERKSMSFFIGKQLWDKSSSDERLKILYIVTNLMNSSTDLLTNAHEKMNLIQLNYFSGQKAKQTAAFQLALNYFQVAINLLEQSHWQDDYEFSLQLFKSTAEVAYCVTNYDLMNKIITNVMENAKSILDKTD